MKNSLITKRGKWKRKFNGNQKKKGIIRFQLKAADKFQLNISRDVDCGGLFLAKRSLILLSCPVLFILVRRRLDFQCDNDTLGVISPHSLSL